MAADYRDRGRWDEEDDEDERLVRPSGGGIGPSSIAYESGRRRSGRRRIMALAIVLLSVGGIAAVMWYASDQGQNSGGDSVVPLISAENAPAKVRPDQPGGMDVPNQDKLIYDRLNPNQAGQAPVERLLPPPEAPAARPEPPAVASPPESLLPANPPAAEPPPVAAIPEAQTIAPRPTPAQVPNQAPSEPAKPATPAPQAAPSKPAQSQTASVPPAGGTVRVQLGAVRTREGAQQEWARLQKANKDLLGGLSLTVSQANLANGTFYRIQTSPVGDRAAADALCAKLKARKVGCLIVR